MTLTQQILIVSVSVVATMLTRFLPFLLFRSGRETPQYVLYLGKVLPASVFALLVIYCLRQVPFLGMWDKMLAQLISVGFTVAVHVWRKNMMWSIAAGTICYMILLTVC